MAERDGQRPASVRKGFGYPFGRQGKFDPGENVPVGAAGRLHPAAGVGVGAILEHTWHALLRLVHAHPVVGDVDRLLYCPFVVAPAGRRA